MFGDGQWPMAYYVVPDFTALDAWQGGVAWVTGVSAGSVAYRGFVPVAAAAMVWALWRLLRGWGARRPVVGLGLGLVVLVWGGYAHATFGNLSLVRIWQGKAVFVSVLVPLLWAVLAGVWRGGGDRRAVRRVLFVVAACGVAGVGLTQAAVFVVPLVAVAGAVPVLVRRRWRLAVVLVAAASAAPVASGLAVAATGDAGGTNSWMNSWENGLITPWGVVVGSVPVGVVVLAAVAVLVAGWRWPTVRSLVDHDDRPVARQRSLAIAVLAGVLFTLPPLFAVVQLAIGGDAIAFRVAWVLPVPALVGLLASLPGRAVASGTALVATAVLVVAGLPLWSPANSARFERPGAWKVRDPVDLYVARWIVEQDPGTYLAGNWLAGATVVVSSGPRPVGTRMDYLEQMSQVDGARSDQRILLQEFADGAGGRSAEVLAPACQALGDLDVELACVAWPDDLSVDLFTSAGFEQALTAGPWGCWVRP